MRNRMLLFLVILLSLTMTNSVFAGSSSKAYDNGGIVFGLKCAPETIARTADINGGSYFYLNSVISINPTFSLNLKYSTDLAPRTFSDHLFSVTPQFVIKTISTYEREIAQMYLGLTYLRSTDNNYFGIKYCPWAIGRGIPNEDVIIELIPISFLYCPETAEKVIMFEFITIGGYF